MDEQFIKDTILANVKKDLAEFKKLRHFEHSREDWHGEQKLGLKHELATEMDRVLYRPDAWFGQLDNKDRCKISRVRKRMEKARELLCFIDGQGRTVEVALPTKRAKECTTRYAKALNEKERRREEFANS